MRIMDVDCNFKAKKRKKDMEINIKDLGSSQYNNQENMKGKPNKRLSQER